jgi:hypothetical protein
MTNPTILARLLLAVLGLSGAAAASAAATMDCGSLCGHWQLDAAASDPVEARVDAALETWRPPRSPRLRSDRPAGPPGAEPETPDFLRMPPNRPDRGQLRDELLAALKPSERLHISVAGADVVIGATDDARAARRYSPGVPHARIDAQGTTRIRAALSAGKFTLTERGERGRDYAETYTVQRADGSLMVERQITRAGLKTLRVVAIYRPG